MGLSIQLEIWQLTRLVPYARNPRKNDHVIDRMVSSIREFGFKVPLLARSNGDVIDGHLRVKAAEKLGITEVPVILCDDWSDAQVKAFRLLVNRSVNWADWDDELLSLEMLDLRSLDFDLELTGFDLSELEAFMASPEPVHGLTDEDAVPEVADVPVSAVGDVWLLGDHRLLCGDAMSAADATKLMAGEA